MPENDCIFRTESADGAIVVVPTGEHIGFEMMEVQREAREIAEALESGEGPNVVVDACETAYLSSTVIGALIRVWEAAEKQGGKVLLCNLNDDAMAAIIATRLDTRWPSFPTRAEALASL
jgi:anti-anti-sigma factor